MKLHVRTWGHAGDPAVVLVHGVQASSRTWWRMSPALAEQGWHVLAVDLRGHGLSPRAPVPFGLDELAADLWETVDAVIDRDRAGRAPVLWGHSLGALTVLEAVRLRPGGASRLVLEEPPGDLTVDVRQVADGVRADVSAARRDLPAFLARQRAEQPGYAEGDILAREDVARCQADLVVASLEAGLLPDLVGRLRALDVPALLVAGAEARGSTLAGHERLAAFAALPPEHVVQLDAGHGVHRERFEDYLAATTFWLGPP